MNNIYENLCWHDPRNPFNIDQETEDKDTSKPCFCDNCFYGRKELAELVLLLAERIDVLIENIDDVTAYFDMLEWFDHEYLEQSRQIVKNILLDGVIPDRKEN